LSSLDCGSLKSEHSRSRMKANLKAGTASLVRFQANFYPAASDLIAMIVGVILRIPGEVPGAVPCPEFRRVAGTSLTELKIPSDDPVRDGQLSRSFKAIAVVPLIFSV